MHLHAVAPSAVDQFRHMVDAYLKLERSGSLVVPTSNA